ncbi:hypothetical protein SNE40_022488 [Patella caerulea]|uniref:Reverse transcriptase domain-containing protein n=1 Tax=Patella caerulea TaxID=87958 RepID=A0AAN8G0H3_PATCE
MTLLKCIAYLDFSKAFDLIDHKFTIEKLHIYRFDKNSQILIESYLDSPEQTVCLGSLITTVKCGVLGPLLYLIFRDDPPLNVELSQTTKVDVYELPKLRSRTRVGEEMLEEAGEAQADIFEEDGCRTIPPKS